MALNLYRRHGSNCVGGRSLHEMTYESDELRRNWKRCYCPIYASGTLSGRFKRKNTERRTWPEANAIASACEATERWDGSVNSPPPPPVPQPAAESAKSDGITIERAIKAFLAEYFESAATNTYKKYSIMTNKLKAYSAAREVL